MRRHVLILDEDAALLGLYADLLEGEGYRVTLLDHLPTDLGEIDRMAPDVIVVDYLFDGHAAGGPLLHALQARPATKHLPILVCTGAARTMQAQAALLHAAQVGVLLKPFAVEALLAGIRELLGEGRDDGQTVLVPAAD
jgi:two-component system phosphate regulon response regulator PhoB